MPLYPNPKGGSMQAANDADARAKGWTPAMGSFGVNTYPTGGGGSGGASASVSAPPQDAAAALGKIQQNILSAIASGNKAAADEAIRQFNATFGLDQQKFTESVRQYNQTFGLDQQKLTADIAAQAAGLSGWFNGQPTEAARQFNVTAMQNAVDEQHRTGLSALTLASTNQADPFRRLATQYSLAQNPDYMAGMQAVINGVQGQNGIAQQQAPGLSSAQSASLGGLQDSVGSTVAGTPGDTMSGGQGGTFAQGQATLAGLPANNQTIARNFNLLGPSAQAAYLSAQSAKTGMLPEDLKAQINSTLPKFTAPSFGLSSV